ncbi:MAG: ester cyclase [Deltaproteobacteria bacterium]|nr:ester cyclase [Deltaproteobacteria bacterium]
MTQKMLELFQKHVNAELAGDLETTMATMTENPHLHNIPVQMGGVGREAVQKFYKNHLVGKFFPPDVEMIPISQTIGTDQVVDELVARFTHTMMMDWMLPNVPPTNKKVQIGIVVVVRFENNKIAHEHIYWDQASVLVQIGLLNPAGLPVSGAESATKILKLKRK